VTAAVEEKIGPAVDGNRAGYVQDKDERDQEPDVEQLVAPTTP
jgi:hypothetical protein